MPDGALDGIGEIGGVIRTMLGLSRHSRIRDQIRGTVELYDMTVRHEGLRKASGDLARVIEQQTGRLVEVAETSKRAWNWAALIVAWIVAGAFGAGMYFLASDWGTWWGTLLMLVFGLGGVLLFIAGLGTLLQKREDQA
jgi:hypothetical protein